MELFLFQINWAQSRGQYPSELNQLMPRLSISSHKLLADIATKIRRDDIFLYGKLMAERRLKPPERWHLIAQRKAHNSNLSFEVLRWPFWERGIPVPEDFVTTKTSKRNIF